MRWAGIVQTPDLRSISDHVAPITSLVRPAVRIANSSAFALTPVRSRSSAMKAGSSGYGRAAWFLTARTLRRLGNSLSR